MPPDSTRFYILPRARRILLKQNTLKTSRFGAALETVLGAGGRQFESARPDQLFQVVVALLLAVAKSRVADFEVAAFLKIQRLA